MNETFSHKIHYAKKRCPVCKHNMKKPWRYQNKIMCGKCYNTIRMRIHVIRQYGIEGKLITCPRCKYRFYTRTKVVAKCIECNKRIIMDRTAYNEFHRKYHALKRGGKENGSNNKN